MKRSLLKISTIFLIILSTYSIILLNEKIIIEICREDGPVENYGALFHLISAILFFTAFAYSKIDINYRWQKILGQKNLFYLLLGVLFFICFGEEISWGQRIFNIKTPEIINKYNAQNEINLHNLWIFYATNPDGQRKSFIALMLNMSRLFSIFWLLYCVVIPIVDNLSVRINSIFKNINFPVPPLWFGTIFLTNYIAFKLVCYFLADSKLEVLSSINELKESNYAFIFSILAYTEVKKQKKINQKKKVFGGGPALSNIKSDNMN